MKHRIRLTTHLPRLLLGALCIWGLFAATVGCGSPVAETRSAPCLSNVEH